MRYFKILAGEENMARHEISSNEMLMLGVGVLIVGIVLASYSFSTYSEMKQLENQFDFDTLDKNTQISSSDKYYKYLEYSDILNQKLKANKNIPMKNVACVYLDYAQHNATALYDLTDKKMSMDSEKKSVALSNIRALNKMLEDYKTCSNASAYKTVLDEILEGASNAEKDKLRADERMNEFLYGDEPKVPELGTPEEQQQYENQQNQTPAIQPQNVPNYIDNSGHAQSLTQEQIDYINSQQVQTSKTE